MAKGKDKGRAWVRLRNMPVYWHVLFVYLGVVIMQVAIIVERGELRQSDTDLLLIYTAVNLVVMIKLIFFPANKR